MHLIFMESITKPIMNAHDFINHNLNLILIVPIEEEIASMLDERVDAT